MVCAEHACTSCWGQVQDWRCHCLTVLLQAVTINSKGYFGDCNLLPVMPAYTYETTCMPRNFTVAPGRSALLPWASQNMAGQRYP